MEIGKIANVSALTAVEPTSPITPREREQQQQLIQAVAAVNSAQLFGEFTELTFSYDRHARKTVLRIVDRKTGEVVQQLPPEDLLRLATALGRV